VDKLLAADNLCIVALAAWVITLKIEAIAMRKENSANWRLVDRMRRLTQRMYKHVTGATNLDETGQFYGTPQD
jgi:hypothetical protein